MNYRVEFNEEQQAFHLSRGNADRPNTNGWWTVVDSCSDQMYWEFICMLETLHEKPYDRKKILNAHAKLAVFWDKLSKNRLLIVKQEDIPTTKSIVSVWPEDNIDFAKSCLVCGEVNCNLHKGLIPTTP